MEKTINVGLIGCGTVGSGVVDLFQKKQPKGINLKTVVVKDINKKRTCDFPNITTDVNKVLEDPEIDIVVEVIGGYDPAKEYIIKAIKNKKNVVTANKAVIADHGPEIFKEAAVNKVDVGFEAAVAGGIPIINPLLEQLSLGSIKSIVGILNGTTNFILTKMGEGMKYEDALKLAQEKGFAEADPTFDVGGMDAVQKIAIMGSLAFGKWIDPKEVYCRGIEKITPIDLEYAKNLGYTIKLLAIAKKTKNDEIDIRVHPALLPKTHPLAEVNNEFNAISIKGEPFDEYFNSGKGAGQGPTAFSVYYDIIKIASMVKSGIVRVIRINHTDSKIADQDNISAKGYLRVYLNHIPGSLHKLLGVLYKHRWNVKDSLQRDKPEYEAVIEGTKCLPNIITHESLTTGVIKKTLVELREDKIEGGKPICGEPFHLFMYSDN